MPGSTEPIRAVAVAVAISFPRGLHVPGRVEPLGQVERGPFGAGSHAFIPSLGRQI
jgi:hypothetical protein